jgi:hypothetical protein
MKMNKMYHVYNIENGREIVGDAGDAAEMIGGELARLKLINIWENMLDRGVSQREADSVFFQFLKDQARGTDWQVEQAN